MYLINQQLTQKAWKGYKSFAWGMDELQPNSKRGHDWFKMGLTIIDTLDTAYLMGETDIYNECRDWVQNSFHLNESQRSSVFETNIRVVGGFLSTYNLTGDTLFLDKAREVADHLLNAIHPQSKIPFPY